MQIISRRFRDNYIIHNIDKNEIQDLLRFIALISFLSFIGIVRISGSNEKNSFIERSFKEIKERYL